MRGDIWRELVLVGHWISQAIVLRWAELTHEISQRRVAVSEVIDKLLILPETDREQRRLRQLYANLPDLRCTWTEQPLHRRFDVDHVIPYSLWHNNDLWNLVPVAPGANNRKRDKLISRERLRHCRDRVIDCWTAARNEHPRQFDYEMQRSLVGGRHLGNNWENTAFFALSEVVEELACRRGIPRWPEA